MKTDSTIDNASENLLFFSELYRKKIIDKEMLFLLLSRRDAEAVIIGSDIGEKASKYFKQQFLKGRGY